MTHTDEKVVKRRCGITVCVCIVTDFIILILYWRKIVDALRNPFLAMFESLGQKNLNEQYDIFQHFHKIDLSRNNSNENPGWVHKDTPTVGRMIYHFGGAVMYIGYTSMNIKLLMNVIIKLYYMNRPAPSFNPADYRTLRPFIFDCQGRMEYCYGMTLVVLHILIFLDEIIFSSAVGLKLPFNELFLWGLTTLAYQAIGQGIKSIFFILFKLFVFPNIISLKLCALLLSISYFFWDDSKVILTDIEKAAKTNIEGVITEDVETHTRSADKDVKTLFNRHKSLIHDIKPHELPPSYEQETLPPTYSEALVLASANETEIHP